MIVRRNNGFFFGAVRRHRRRVLGVATAAVMLAAVTTATTAGTALGADHVEIVASGLDQPRGLDFAANGALLIAEAGRGGDEGCGDPILTEEPMCLGATGAITMIKRNGQQSRLVDGLPSIANQSDGNFAFGPHDVATDRGRIYVAIGGPGNDLDRSDFAPSYADLLGTVQRVRGHRTATVADIAAFEEEFNPHPTRPQSQTQAVERIGRQLYATDAAGNTIVRINRRGAVDLVAALPDRTDGNITYEAVPSGLTEGPDGALYLSDVTGAPFPEGGAIVWRLGRGGFVPYATGFTTAIDLAFGPDGSLFVVENRPGAAGRVLRLAPGVVDAADAEIVVDGLNFPTGIAVSDDGAVYVSNNGVFAGMGEVLRIG